MADTERAYNPNFPENLRIHPSDRTSDVSTRHLDLKDFDEANFGLQAQEVAIGKYGIAGRVWEAAYMMILYIQPPPHMQFDYPLIDTSNGPGKITIVELGSGTGLVAAYLSKLLKPGRGHLIVTDLPEVCPLLEQNLSSVKAKIKTSFPNQNAVLVRPLSWGVYEDAVTLASEHFGDPTSQSNVGPLTHIICSDLVYFPELFAPLLRSLLHLSSPPFTVDNVDLSDNIGPTILISYKIRSLSKETAFWSAFGLWFEFSSVLVKDKQIKGDWQRFGENFEDATFLFRAHRRPESFRWTVPPLDPDLLAGVGANGTNSRKGDDTFESILLLTLDG